MQVYLSSTSGTCVFDRELCSAEEGLLFRLQRGAAGHLATECVRVHVCVQLPGNNHHCEAAPSPCSHACSRQPPTRVT